jgi:uncharacterized protein (DUF305 family)
VTRLCEPRTVARARESEEYSVRRWIVVPLVAAVLAVPACTGDEGDGGGQAGTSGPSVIAPGKPGEDNKTLSPEEAKSAVPKSKANEADVAFMRDMVMHHSQAVVMTDLAKTRAASGPVKGIAKRIAGAQRAEIDMMNLWLKRHGHEPLMVPGAKGYQEGHGHGGHHGMPDSHGDHEGMPGMATQKQLDELAAASGAKFDELFLKLMITHHEGALTMSREVQRKGSDTRVQEIADEIIATQTAEITKMKAMQRG